MTQPVDLTPEVLRSLPLPSHEDGDDKEGRGRVVIVGGSAEIPGAALLAGVAALRVGAGKLQIATCESVAAPLAIAVPEARVIALAQSEQGGIAVSEAERLAAALSEAASAVIGPGMSDPEATVALTAALLKTRGPPLLLDAGALRQLADQAPALAARGGQVVLTPHAGEMASCLGINIEAVQAAPMETALSAATRFNAVVALKGKATIIAAPDGRAFINRRGDVGLATSGSGDVLAGLIGGLLARGADPLVACLWGVHLHAEAGARLRERIGLGFLAREIPDEAPKILAEWCS